VTDTDDDIRPTGLDGKIDLAAVARVVRKSIPIVVPAIVAIVTSLVTVVAQVRVALTDAKSSAKVVAKDVAKDVGQGVKNKSEAGYQELKAAVEAYEVRLAVIERRLAEVPKKGKRKPPTPAPVRRLPADLDQAAARQNLRLVVPALAPAAAGTHVDASP
jgi:hypothetical protein